VGQGNGAEPAIWGVLSSPALDLIRALGLGVKITTAISQEGLHLAGFSFVDDTDLAQTASTATSVMKVLRDI
jgi:hypothetical protein